MWRVIDFFVYKILKVHRSTRESIIEDLLIEILTDTMHPINVLDLGSGAGGYWNAILARIPESVRTRVKLFLVDASPEVIGKDICLVSPEKVVGAAPEILAGFSNQFFHLVVCLDFLEHLPKYEGHRTLYELDRVCSNISVVATPNGFVWQPGSANNPFNAHLSGWTTSELKQHNYKEIIGIAGFKHQIGPYGAVKKDVSLQRSTNYVYPLTQSIPRFSFGILGVKRGQNPRIDFQ